MKINYFAACVPLLLLFGCSAYLPDYYYLPHPGSVQVGATQPSESPPASVFASVVGVRKADDQLHIPFSVEMRLRLDNHATEPITFDPKSIDLTTGDLQRFQPPVTDMQAPVTLDPGKSLVLIANFPFPSAGSHDGTDLASLQLRWPMRIGSRSVAAVLNFEREGYGYGPYYDDGPYGYEPGPYWYPYPVFRGAIVIHRR